MTTSAEILSFNITKINALFIVSHDKSIEIKCQIQFKITKPDNFQDTKAICFAKFILETPSDENIKVEAESQSLVEFDEAPENYDEAAEAFCFDKLKDIFLKRIDDIIENMGYPKFNFA